MREAQPTRAATASGSIKILLARSEVPGSRHLSTSQSLSSWCMTLCGGLCFHAWWQGPEPLPQTGHVLQPSRAEPMLIPISSKSPTESTHTVKTAESGKSMHAISEIVSQTESRVDTWQQGSHFDDPYVFGQHGGQRLWHLYENLFLIEKNMKTGDIKTPN